MSVVWSIVSEQTHSCSIHNKSIIYYIESCVAILLTSHSSVEVNQILVRTTGSLNQYLENQIVIENHVADFQQAKWAKHYKFYTNGI